MANGSILNKLKNLMKSICINQTEFMLNLPIISNLLKQLYICHCDITVKLLNCFDKLDPLYLSVSMMAIVIIF